MKTIVIQEATHNTNFFGTVVETKNILFLWDTSYIVESFYQTGSHSYKLVIPTDFNRHIEKGTLMLEIHYRLPSGINRIEAIQRSQIIRRDLYRHLRISGRRLALGKSAIVFDKGRFILEVIADAN